MQTRLLTVKDVAERLGVGAPTIRAWVRGIYQNGRGLAAYKKEFIPAQRLPNGQLRFKESDLNNWIEQRLAAA